MKYIEDDVAQLLLQHQQEVGTKAEGLRLAKGRVQPLASFRCREGCSLLKAYQTPNGVLLHHPAVRLSRSYGRGNGIPAAIYQGSVHDGARSTDVSLVVDERVTLLTDTMTEPRLLACKHGIVNVSVEDVRTAVRRHEHQLVDVLA